MEKQSVSRYSLKRLKYILGALIVLQVADAVMTNVLIWKGIAHEGNPFLTHLAGAHGLVVIKVIGVLLAVLIIWDIYQRFPRLAFWTSSAFLGIYTAVVIWNMIILIIGSQALAL